MSGPGEVPLRGATALAAALVAAAAAVLTAQTPAPAAQPGVREVSRSAEELVAAGRFGDAVARLESALAGCPLTPAGGACRTLLAYSLGYVEHAWSRAEPARGHLQRAAEWYATALDADSSNGRIRAALAQVAGELGDVDRAGELLAEAARFDPAHAGDYSLLLGDLLVAERRFASGVAAYRRAAEAGRLEVALARILVAYRRDPQVDVRALRALAKEAAGAPELAAEALALAVGRSYRRSEAEAEQIVRDWVDLQVQRGVVLTQADLRALPSPQQWPSPALVELHALVIEPLRAAEHLEWWKRQPLRQDIAARLLHNRARQEGSREDTRRANALLDAARRLAPPAYSAEYTPELRGRSMIELDVALDLVLAYERQGQIERSDALIQELFNEKTEAYMRGNFAAIERYHTVLGLVFAGREQWTSHWADNATYQLERALSAGERLARESGRPARPAPGLQSLLAQGYAALGRREDAATARLRAATGFLDLDDVRRATQEIESCARLGCASAAVDGLRRIARTRMELQDGRGSLAFLVEPDGTIRLVEADGWIAGAMIPALDAEFVERQRFKSLADGAEIAASGGQPAAANALRAMALEQARGQESLPSLGDAARIRKIESAFAGEVKLLGGGETVRLDRSPLPAAKDVKTWTIDTPQGAVTLSAADDLFLAGQILSQLELATAVQRGELELSVAAGKVAVQATPETVDEKTVASSAGKLERVRGVRDVVVLQGKAESKAQEPPP